MLPKQRSQYCFICEDMRPLSVVENEGFRIMITTLEPRYIIPSRQHITDITLTKLYNEVKATVLGSQLSRESRFDMRRLDFKGH